MKKSDVDNAKKEIKRLLDKIEEMEVLCDRHDYSIKKDNPVYDGGKYTAAVRRASMDVTRSLVILRRYG